MIRDGPGEKGNKACACREFPLAPRSGERGAEGRVRGGSVLIT